MTKMAKIILPLILCGVLSGGLFLHPASGNNQPPKAPAVPVKVIAVVKKDIPVKIEALGTVVPYQTVALKSRIDSQIIEVKFKDGDNVKKGDPLFILDGRGLQAQLDQAKADQAAAQAQAANLRKQYVRNQGLIKQSAISQQLYEDSKAALDAQVAIAEAAKAAVENIEVELGYTIITAPIDGRAGTINFTVGNNIKANDTTPLVTINQVTPVQVQVSLPQDYFDPLRSAMAQGVVPVQAQRNTAAAVSVAGTFSYIDNMIDQTTGTFVGRAVFANEGEQLWPGMLVNLTINVGNDRQALTIPEVAIQNSPSGKFVFVIADNKAKKANVTVERIQDGMAIVTQGLTENDKVAIDGIMALKDGASVTVNPGPATPEPKSN